MLRLQTFLTRTAITLWVAWAICFLLVVASSADAKSDSNWVHIPAVAADYIGYTDAGAVVVLLAVAFTNRDKNKPVRR